MTDKIDRLIAEVERLDALVWTDRNEAGAVASLREAAPTLASALKALRAAARDYAKACDIIDHAAAREAWDKLAALVGWERGSDD